jgi:hypothetical protein
MKREQENARLAGALPDFKLDNLLNEGVLKLRLENTCCKLVKMNFRWEIFLS